MKFFLLTAVLIFKISHSLAATDPLIETYQCDGSETTVAKDFGKWGEYACLPGEWLVRIDEMNPFTVRVEKSRTMRDDAHKYFNMVPTIPVDSKTRWILKRHWLRVNLSGYVEYIPKRREE